MSSAAPKKHPILLKICLGLMLGVNFTNLIIYTVMRSHVMQYLPQAAPPWYVNFLVGGCLINLISVLLLWTWHRLGFYILALTSVVFASINFFLVHYPLMYSINGFIGLAIVYVGMWPARKQFKQI